MHCKSDFLIYVGRHQESRDVCKAHADFHAYKTISAKAMNPG